MDKDKQLKKMTETPVAALVLSLAVPTVISMLVTSFYNIADTYFVSKLGTSASGAVGVVFSLMAIIQAVGFTIGMGSGSIISRLLGSGKNDEADSLAVSALFLGLTMGVILALPSYFFLKPLMRLFGATPTILPYAVSYAKYIIIGAPVMIASFIMNNLLRSQGRAKYAMAGITAGGILNVILDPIFIFRLNLGTSGAAIATLLSQCVSFLLLLIFCLSGKGVVKFKISAISHCAGMYLEIFKMGLPSLSRQGLSGVATMLLNNNAAVFGDAAVAAMSIVGKIFMIIFAVIIGIGQGFQPVVGFNYGAGRNDRVKKAFYFTLIFGGIAMTTLAGGAFIFSERLMTLFTKGDMAVIEIGKFALKAQCVAAPLMAVSTVCNMSYQMAGKSGTASLLACTRQGIFFVPLIIVLPYFLGILGVQLAQPLADALAVAFSVPFGIKFLRDLDRQQ